MANYLITGGAGFIGSNFLNMMVNKYPHHRFICFDKLTYAGNKNNLNKIWDKSNFKFVLGDICNEKVVFNLFKNEQIDYVVNFAAETHVDRSNLYPKLFFKTNVLGTLNLLKASVKYKIKRFHQVSTDEVYGETDIHNDFKEEDLLNPSNPYSISKASADLLVLSYFQTYNLPITISRSSNNYGPNQYDEKLIPLVIKKAYSNKKIPLYGNGENYRDWLFVEDCCEAIRLILEKGKNGQIYHIASDVKIDNLTLIRLILKKLNKSEKLIKFVKDRPNHDKGYSLNTEKIKSELHWETKVSFEEGINATINHYLEILTKS